MSVDAKVAIAIRGKLGDRIPRGVEIRRARRDVAGVEPLSRHPIGKVSIEGKKYIVYRSATDGDVVWIEEVK